MPPGGDEAGSSQAPASPPPPSPRPQAGSAQAPPVPETLFKQKVRWSWQSFTTERAAPSVRLFSTDDNDTSMVKGDADGELAAETDRQMEARVDDEANKTGLQADILLHDNDVAREQVDAASDRFVSDTVQLVEEVDGEHGGLLEDVLGRNVFKRSHDGEEELGGEVGAVDGADSDVGGGATSAALSDDDFVAPPVSKKTTGVAAPVSKKTTGEAAGESAVVCAQRAALNGVEQSIAGEEAEELASATAAVSGQGSAICFGKIFKSGNLADALVRSWHSPLRRVPTP